MQQQTPGLLVSGRGIPLHALVQILQTCRSLFVAGSCRHAIPLVSLGRFRLRQITACCRVEGRIGLAAKDQGRLLLAVARSEAVQQVGIFPVSLTLQAFCLGEYHVRIGLCAAGPQFVNEGAGPVTAVSDGGNPAWWRRQ